MTTVSQDSPLFLFHVVFLPYLDSHGSSKAPHQAPDVQPSPGKRPYSEVYSEWASGEENISKEDKAEEVVGSQINEGDQAIPMEESTEKGDILQPL